MKNTGNKLFSSPNSETAAALLSGSESLKHGPTSESSTRSQHNPSWEQWSGPVTKEITVEEGTRFGKKISVIDTPGVLGSEGEIRTWCQNLLQTSTPCLFLVVVGIDRFTDEQKNSVEAALRVIGDQESNSYLLFTKGERLGSESLDEFINADPEGPLRPFAERFAGRLHVFNNEDRGQEQVKELLEKSGHLRDDSRPISERRVVLLGLPGKGKSASGNTILGSERFRSDCDPDPVTTKTDSRSAIVEGRQVTAVDTPGFTDKVLSPEKLFNEIIESVKKAEPGPDAFLIVVEIGRVMPVEIEMHEFLLKMFGEHAEKYFMVLFTHGDKLRGRPIETYINGKRELKDLVDRCGGRYCVFDNTKIGNREQVRKLLDEIDVMVKTNEQRFTSEMLKKPPTWLESLWECFLQLLAKIKKALGFGKKGGADGNRESGGGKYEKLREDDCELKKVTVDKTGVEDIGSSE
ncbi:GTPase IMAP family member 8-like [Xyrichtys novacula]|uniref:GTPase IMAP family member 8 n=1 Tax=Xyrichtys novacula TaxID=13765 RepID=A0AAV1FR76_XYRNO|nr:GTPase IMAP family member 8-like [Xyrichtys novacula]